jgi:hypothetical protein
MKLRNRKGFIYIARRPPLLRIGFTTNPHKRLIALRSASDFPALHKASVHTKLIATIPGWLKDESRIHQIVGLLKCHGSWYVDCQELREKLRALGFDIKPIKKRYSYPKRIWK